MECHGSDDSAKSEPMRLFISVGEPELQNEGQHNYVHGSRAEVHNVVSLVTMDVAPGVCWNKAGKWIHQLR